MASLTNYSYQDYCQLVKNLSEHDGQKKLYVFAYGSLMWRPEIIFVTAWRARVSGYHRRFGLWSYHYRGTKQLPGVVLGLDMGGNCEGICYEIAESQIELVIKKLWDREMISYAYQPTAVMATLGNVVANVKNIKTNNQPLRTQPVLPSALEKKISALTFILNTSHEQYVPKDLAKEKIIEIIQTAKGNSGSNQQYLLETYEKLQQLNIHDPMLHELVHQIKSVPR